ncbi:MAG: orotidine-5'-phosphate decarboxylase [Candidatus Omnitrophota bacterium]
MKANDRLIVALDVDSEKKALALVDKLRNDVRVFKVGLELFSSCGPGILEAIKERERDIFLDLKFHDIPNTVARAAASVTRLGVFILNVHALGGYDMMKEACGAVKLEAQRLGIERPRVLAVTILTSMDENGLKKVGIHDTIQKEVVRLALIAKDAGADGVVASPSEAKLIRENAGEGFIIVTPGVRPAWAAKNDQKRIATPAEAVRNGANFIVVGRPITEAADPVRAAKEIIEEMTI